MQETKRFRIIVKAICKRKYLNKHNTIMTVFALTFLTYLYQRTLFEKAAAFGQANVISAHSHLLHNNNTKQETEKF